MARRSKATKGKKLIEAETVGVVEAAKMLTVHPHTVRLWISEGDQFRKGTFYQNKRRHWRLSIAEIERVRQERSRADAEEASASLAADLVRRRARQIMEPAFAMMIFNMEETIRLNEQVEQSDDSEQFALESQLFMYLETLHEALSAVREGSRFFNFAEDLPRARLTGAFGYTYDALRRQFHRKLDVLRRDWDEGRIGDESFLRGYGDLVIFGLYAASQTGEKGKAQLLRKMAMYARGFGITADSLENSLSKGMNDADSLQGRVDPKEFKDAVRKIAGHIRELDVTWEKLEKSGHYPDDGGGW